MDLFFLENEIIPHTDKEGIANAGGAAESLTSARSNKTHELRPNSECDFTLVTTPYT